MKTLLFFMCVVLALGTGAMAEPDRAPFIDKQIKELTKKVDADLASGALTKTDGDELKRSIKHVQTVAQSEPTLTPLTRRNLREELSKIQSDLARKENQAKALPSASPSVSP
jgi:hypothetical protein